VQLMAPERASPIYVPFCYLRSGRDRTQPYWPDGLAFIQLRAWEPHMSRTYYTAPSYDPFDSL